MILICGATGTIGGRVTRRLASMGVPAQAFVRGGGSPRIPAGIDRVFLLSPNLPEQETIESGVIAAAASAGVKHIVKLSVMGAGRDAESEFGRLHARVEAELAKSGMSWTAIRPNMMMQNLFWYKQAIWQGVLPLPLGDAAVSHVDAEDIAAVAAEALTGEGHEGKVYTLTGPEALTCDAVAATLSKALNKTIRYQPISSADFRAFLTGAGEAPSIIDAEVDLFAAWSRGAGSAVTDTVAAVTHKPANTLADFVARQSAVFTS